MTKRSSVMDDKLLSEMILTNPSETSGKQDLAKIQGTEM